ncbi:MAG TPA: hypothetical protein PLX66_00155 [Bacilli bacterium]|nr:hypothetical protein [Bacilli bacterium]
MKPKILKTSNIATMLTFDDGSGKELIINFADNLDLTFSLRLVDKNGDLTFTISKNDEQIFSIFNIFFDEILNSKADPTLVKEGTITWTDDYSPENNGEAFTIEKIDENAFKITFKRAEGTRIKRTISVRIANSGSRYNLFTRYFMSLFKNLANFINSLPEENNIILEKKPD